MTPIALPLGCLVELSRVALHVSVRRTSTEARAGGVVPFSRLYPQSLLRVDGIADMGVKKGPPPGRTEYCRLTLHLSTQRLQ